jgi:hypothetical protein
MDMYGVYAESCGLSRLLPDRWPACLWPPASPPPRIPLTPVLATTTTASHPGPPGSGSSQTWPRTRWRGPAPRANRSHCSKLDAQPELSILVPDKANNTLSIVGSGVRTQASSGGIDNPLRPTPTGSPSPPCSDELLGPTVMASPAPLRRPPPYPPVTSPQPSVCAAGSGKQKTQVNRTRRFRNLPKTRINQGAPDVTGLARLEQ